MASSKVFYADSHAISRFFTTAQSFKILSCAPTSTSTFISKLNIIDEEALSNEFQINSKDGVNLIPFAVHPSILSIVQEKGRNGSTVSQGVSWGLVSY